MFTIMGSKKLNTNELNQTTEIYYTSRLDYYKVIDLLLPISIKNSRFKVKKLH